MPSSWPLDVDQRAARETRQQRHVGADVGVEQSALGRAPRAADGADGAEAGDRLGRAGPTDGQRQVAGLQLAWLARGSARVAGRRAGTLRTARSLAGSRPTSRAGCCPPSGAVMDRSVSRSRTCAAVTTWSSRQARPLAGNRRRPWTATTERAARCTALARSSDRLARTPRPLAGSESVMQQV